jgi:hypothetical protein
MPVTLPRKSIVQVKRYFDLVPPRISSIHQKRSCVSFFKLHCKIVNEHIIPFTTNLLQFVSERLEDMETGHWKKRNTFVDLSRLRNLTMGL